MSFITIQKWTRKRSDRPRFYITDGREPAGTIFESKGVFSAVSPDGRLVAVRENLKAAVDALIPATGVSS
jgi:hypothetical protein